ncbi:MAG: MFS transporter [Bacteroidota bacterium]|nr:MFS transporter [Bacteroidota bacterium]
MNSTKKSSRTPWSWIPSLYFAEGIPYIIVMFVASDMYKTLGVSNAKLAFWTSLLYLPWVVKPLWSPFVDIYSTKRKWIVWMQLVLALSFFGVSLVLQTPWWFSLSLVFLWLMALASSTHDIAADGFYMLALDEHNQAFFTGIRSTFYRLAMIAGLGLLVIITGLILDRTGLETVRIEIEATDQVQSTEAFNIADFQTTAGEEKPKILFYPEKVQVPLCKESKLENCDSTIIYFVLSSPPEDDEVIKMNFGHKKGSQDIYLASEGFFVFDKKNWNIPREAVIKVKPNLRVSARASFDAKAGNVPFSWAVSIGFLAILFLLFSIYHKYVLPYPESANEDKESAGGSYLHVFKTFFQKEGIVPSITFLLFYRFAESQLTKMASPFLLDTRENGGLALSLTEKGIAYGTVGLIALVVGGILGGILASRHGLKKWIWWMAISINIPNMVYIFLAYVQPGNLYVVNACIALEQFGYGFGFTAYMLYMLYIAGQGQYKTAHFAITTGFMALGMMIPGMISGTIQEFLGYQHFFIYVIICTIPSFVALWFIKVDPGFGIKKAEE